MNRQNNSLTLFLLVVTSILKAQTTVQSWTLLAPTGPLPDGRDNVAAVYSSASNRLIAFGGNLHIAPQKNDLWILNNANGLGTPAWTLAIPSGAPGSPPSRNGSWRDDSYD